MSVAELEQVSSFRFLIIGIREKLSGPNQALITLKEEEIKNANWKHPKLGTG